MQNLIIKYLGHSFDILQEMMVTKTGYTDKLISAEFQPSSDKIKKIY